MPVCAVDGVLVGAAKNGRLVHLDELPEGVNPDHVIEAVPEGDFQTRIEGEISLHSAAEDLLLHHMTFHPSSECAWADVMRRALRVP